MRKPTKELFIKSFSLIKIFITSLIREGVLKEAANLTFISIIAFMPIVSFIVLLLPDIFGVDKSEYIGLILKNFIPETAEKLRDVINSALRIKYNLNLYSFIIVGVSSFSMFSIINRAFDKILDIHEELKPDLITHITKFIGSIFFGFLIVILLFTIMSANVFHNFPGATSIVTFLSYIVPIFLQFLIFIILYFFMPSIRISRGSLLKGTVITTSIWYVLKFGFDIYIRRFSAFKTGYGIIATLPISLLWLYVNWIIILSGILIIAILEKNRRGESLELKREPTKHKLQLVLNVLIDDKEYKCYKKDLNKQEIESILDIVRSTVDDDKTNNGENND